MANISYLPKGDSPILAALKKAGTPSARTDLRPFLQTPVSGLTKEQVLADAAYLGNQAPTSTSNTSVSQPVYSRAAILNNLKNSKANTNSQEYLDMLGRLNASNYQAKAPTAPVPLKTSDDYNAYYQAKQAQPMKKGGKVASKPSKSSTPKAASASKRGDGIAQRGKTRGKMV